MNTIPREDPRRGRIRRRPRGSRRRTLYPPLRGGARSAHHPRGRGRVPCREPPRSALHRAKLTHTDRPERANIPVALAENGGRTTHLVHREGHLAMIGASRRFTRVRFWRSKGARLSVVRGRPMRFPTDTSGGTASGWVRTGANIGHRREKVAGEEFDAHRGHLAFVGAFLAVYRAICSRRKAIAPPPRRKDTPNNRRLRRYLTTTRRPSGVLMVTG